MHPIFRPLIAATILCLAGASAQAAKQDFTLFNNTGYTVDKVFVSSVGKKTWGGDILGTGSLDDGNKVDISFTGESGGCKYDLKVVYDDGDDATWSDVNLCELNNIHIHWDKKAGVTRATGD
jgi:hypothetical protein